MKMAKGKHKGKKSMSTGSLSTFLSVTRATVAKAQAHIGHWPRRFSMSMQSNRGRFAAALAVFATAIIFVACGGGGGGGGTTPPPPPPDPVDAVITLGATTPANGAVDVKVGDPLTAEWSVDKGVYDTSSSTPTCDGSAVAGAWSASKIGGTFTPAADLPRGAACSFSGKVMAKGENGGRSATKNWNVTFQTEAPVALKYPETVYAVWTLGRIYKVAVGGIKVDVTNMSSHPNAGNCGLGKVLADGHKLANCVDPADGKYYPMAINPMDGTMGDFTGTVPADVNWVYLDTGGAHYPTWSSEVLTSTGTYYVDGSHTSTVMFQDLKGVVTTAVAGTFAVDGSIGVLQVVPEKK